MNSFMNHSSRNSYDTHDNRYNDDAISALRALGDKTMTKDKRLRFSTIFMFNTTLDTMMMLFALGGYDCADVFWDRLAPVLKTIFHQCVIHILVASLTLMALAIRVRLATSIRVQYDTLMKNCFKDWSQSTFGTATQ